MTVNVATSSAGSAYRNARRAALLVGVSTLALFMASPEAHARSLGGWTPAPSAAAAAAAQSDSQEAARAARNAQNALKRATQAMQATQQAARDAARAAPGNSGIPNGLGVGGLQVAPQNVPANLWRGANLPTQFTTGDRTKVEIQQTEQRAILTWDTFHVGGMTDVNFKQDASNWVALNRVLGTDGRPSQILGSIDAKGQVYIINQNGIIFGGSSQINVGALIASTAKISNDQFMKGIYSTLAGSTWTPSFTDAAELLGLREGAGKVEVKAGAVIATHAPASVTNGGGFVLLMGGEVVNAGSISTPLGQTQLAAGDDFILRRGVGTDANTFSTTRGNEIAPIMRAASHAGNATNNGLIFSQQGDITIAGQAIAQNGILISTTSVNNRGTIHLLNSATDTAGSVTLSAGSVSTIIPELDSTETALNSQRDALITASTTQNDARSGAAFGAFDNLSKLADRMDQSRIEIVTGGNAIFKSGSLTIAQGGQVAVSAGKRIFVEDGATLDVSGVRDVTLAMPANNLKVNIQGNELRDSPLNRDSNVLRNNDVWIDIRNLILVPKGAGGYDSDRYYTPGGLLEVGGYLTNTAHRIGEWSAVGGTITLSAPEVIAQRAATFDISGGSLNYAAGWIRSTNLIGSDGRRYSVENAPANLDFRNFTGGFTRTHNIQGKVDDRLTEIWTNPLGRGRESVRWEDGYTVGRDAGNLVLSTPTSIFEADIIADVVKGARQTSARAAGLSDGYKQVQNAVPLQGTLGLGRYDATSSQIAAYGSDVRFSNVAAISAGLSATDLLPSVRTNTAWFDAGHLSEQGLGGLTIATRGSIAVDATLTLANGGQVKLLAPTVDINAGIVARSGSVTVQTDILGMVAILPTMPGVTLRAGAIIDVRGLWTNGLADPNELSGLAYVDGGSVTFDSTRSVTLASGSTIDVSSGAAILSTGKMRGGKGGDVTLLADQGNVRSGGRLTLDGEIAGFGVTGGGKLRIESGRVIAIGSKAQQSDGDASLVLNLDASLFRSGFANYSVNGHKGLAVADDATIDVTMPVYRYIADALAVATGSDPSAGLELWTPPLYLEDSAKGRLTQRGGASLSLSAGVLSSDAAAVGLVVGKGAVLTVDPGQSIDISGVGQVTVNGTLNAWGGSIRIGGGGGISDSNSIWIGQTAVLDVAGRAFSAVDLQGRRYGTVLDGGNITIGGTINLSSGQPGGPLAFVVVRDGALLDASGAATTLDLLNGGSTEVASRGGAISFASSDGLDLRGTWRAKAGGAGAAGGTLTVSLGTPEYRDVNASGYRSRDLIVTQTAPGSALAADATPASANGSLVFGKAAIGVDQIEAGGFGNLNLLSYGIIAFDGDVSLAMSQSLQLFSTSLALAETSKADARVTLSAPYMHLSGVPDIRSDGSGHLPVSNTSNGSAPSARQSAARFSATAGLLDVQRSVGFGIRGAGTSFTVDRRGFADVTLQSSGDIRFLHSGSLNRTFLQTRGDLVLAAQQIYPATGASAEVRAGWLKGFDENRAYDPAYSLTIRGTGQAPVAQPFSAFGLLSLGAYTINQGGVVRAPLGTIGLGNESGANTINLLPGSITSTSSKGLIMPYGGTVDGIDWYYADKKIALEGAVSATRGVSLFGVKVDVQSGALIDLSGGGDLTGAGFVSGRGGSIDVLRNPLIKANPVYGFSASGNTVYAIVPNQASGYAPVGPDAGAGNPLVGQQITLDGSVPGLPAGSYTLMPSTYALLPGAFRVEIAATPDSRGLIGQAAMADGSYLAAARLGVANTNIRDSLARQVILTPAKVTRTYSLYNETNYAGFALADAARLGVPRAMLPLDGLNLHLNLVSGAGANAFRFHGAVDFSAGQGGYAGSASLLDNATGGEIEILAAGAAATEGFTGISVYADDLNALSARRLTIGAKPTITYGQTGNYVEFAGTDQSFSITLREGAVLRAAEVFLITGWKRTTGTGAITIEAGAGINTLGMGAVSFDSTDGFIYTPTSSGQGGSMLAVSNGRLDILPANSSLSSRQGAILIGACGASGNCTAPTTLYSEGTIGFATTNRFELGDNVRFGTRNLALGVGAVNVGTREALAAAAATNVLPSGLTLNQTVLDQLLKGDTSTGAPALESLILTARDAVNFFGTVKLDTYDASGKSRITNLVFGTPAIYGAGGSGDVATIRTENLVWSGTTGGPGAVITGGAGTGSGSLVIDAERITFGYGPKTQVSGVDDAGRLALGFASVNLNASDRITANHEGSLAVYQSQGAYVTGAGYSYSGGALNISTPLLTGEAGSVNRITAGGAISVTAPSGAMAGTVLGAEALGAELALDGASVSIATAVTLPSGRLTVSATGDIMLSDAARIDMAGREITFSDVKKYSWGGEVILESRNGDIRQAAGSTIDLSARNNHAGRLTASALGAGAGTVDLQGAILGATSGQYAAGGTIVPYRGGFIDVRAQRLGGSGTLSDQFAALNARLNAGEVFGGRSFQLKQGDLVIGDGLRAGDVNLSLDGGHLTVTGTIDASGAEVGSIRLAANGGLTLTGSAVLDAHGERLRVDSYGKIIDSPNRAIVQLSSGSGVLTLASGVRIDLRHGTKATVGTAPGQYDGVLRGTLELNAPRLGADDIAIDASGALTIQGARSIAVNAVRVYSGAEVPVGTETTASGRPYQFIDQDWLNHRHTESSDFINAALGNATLMNGKLAGLNNSAYRDAFHLRPLVEVRTEGDLVVKGDLDLSGHRYDGVNPHFPHTSVYGSGEVGVLNLRAGGNLDIYGSINDGFAPPPATPDDDGWILRPGLVSFGGDVIVPNGSVTLADGTTFTPGRTLNYDLPVKALTVPTGTRLPAAAVLNGAVLLPANTILAGDVRAADGSLLYAAGTRLAQAVTLPAGTRLGAGFVAPADLSLKAMVWPKGVALPYYVTLDGDLRLPMGGLIPSQTVVKLPNGALSVRLRPADANGRQGANWAVASMLPAGSQSWSMRLVAGADLGAADSRMLRPRDAAGNLTLADSHYSVFDYYQKTIIPGTPARPGGKWYWSDQGAADFGAAPGTPVEDDWGPDFLCADVPSYCIRYNYTVTALAVADLGLDTDWASWGLSAPLKAGDPVPAFFESTLLDSPGYLVSLGEPIPATPETVIVGDFLGYIPLNPIFSVVRTGTGDLDLVAGGNLAQRSPYGVYTAGTQSQGVGAAFDQPRAPIRDGKVLGKEGADYESLVSGDGRLSHAWYPTGGGNLLLRASGNLTGDLWKQSGYSEEMRIYQKPSADPVNWLWRQGHAPGSDAGAAWWINFGSYVRSDDARISSFEYDPLPYLVGFTGFGTLGGGDLRVDVGGNAGAIDKMSGRSQGLVLAVGSTGRVNAQGDLVLTGGGDLDVRIGGSLNPNLLATAIDGGNSGSAQFLDGVIANLRGNSSVSAASIGNIRLDYGVSATREVRPYDPFTVTQAVMFGGPTLLPGDATFALTTRADLVVGGVIDATRRETIDRDPNTPAPAWFSLWSDRTAIDLFAAGGNLTPGNAKMPLTRFGIDVSYPSILRAVAPSGSIFAAPYEAGTLLLAPSPHGELEWLAGQSIYGGVVSRSSADPAILTTPFRPATLASLDPQAFADEYNLFAFGPNTASGLYSLDPARFYALGGDIVGLMTGELQTGFFSAGGNGGKTLYSAGGAVWMKAGRDIVNSGHNLGESGVAATRSSDKGQTKSNLIVHSSETDVSIISAGRDIIYSSFSIAGPGTLEISAGRNIRMEDRASVTSLGAYSPGDSRPGASILVQAGVGASGPDYAKLAALYLDPANLAVTGVPLAEQNGKVARTYEKELAGWLKERHGFAGTVEQALAYFNALKPEQRGIFLRTVYFAELREGGREYNDPSSARFNSYLRGRAVIATLFPGNDYDGDIIMFGGAGVRTLFGGSIQMLTPGGSQVIGVEGQVPPASAGLVTQGSGDIQLYSKGSILLGLSRIMTTFGGDILAWSAEGDINAGRGAKTTIVYTPPKRVYDDYGNVTLSPQVPTSGAGIATLNPIPEVKAGDIDLIAPLGKVDAGEAGIRVSGDINIAAMQILNAANIQVQGRSTGIPTVQAPNISAGLAASNATAATQQTALPSQGSGNDRPSVIIVEVLGYGGGTGEEQPDSEQRRSRGRQSSNNYDSNNVVRLLGNGTFTAEDTKPLTTAERDTLANQIVNPGRGEAAP
ncbi:filamentous hemagglutinin family protein [Rhodopseudomonas rhenobacensis]|uniref:Filamentous hemagglutinin family protein n=1 Tax=Rhodopseudomonas rhenobacensis TaxID=87461 RepID=A0A7W7Z0S3_9BRAD|nr:filamentous haemagglutinin family protein [Rhodopseudomonas rhenobacensis]MBB5045894.1 filamentous hemagglutinin family protein [Rhodopseudomonas rhenobacensis]